MILFILNTVEMFAFSGIINENNFVINIVKTGVCKRHI